MFGYYSAECNDHRSVQLPGITIGSREETRLRLGIVPDIALQLVL
jgi:hypothetical protein